MKHPVQTKGKEEDIEEHVEEIESCYEHTTHDEIYNYLLSKGVDNSVFDIDKIDEMIHNKDINGLNELIRYLSDYKIEASINVDKNGNIMLSPYGCGSQARLEFVIKIDGMDDKYYGIVHRYDTVIFTPHYDPVEVKSVKQQNEIVKVNNTSKTTNKIELEVEIYDDSMSECVLKFNIPHLTKEIIAQFDKFESSVYINDVYILAPLGGNDKTLYMFKPYYVGSTAKTIIINQQIRTHLHYKLKKYLYSC